MPDKYDTYTEPTSAIYETHFYLKLKKTLKSRKNQRFISILDIQKQLVAEDDEVRARIFQKYIRVFWSH